MRKISNIFILLMLVCGCALYCARLSSNEKEYAVADSSYDASVSKEIETILLDYNSLNKIIQSKHSQNSDIMDSPFEEESSVVESKIYNNFFELYQTAITNHMNAKNVEMVSSTGKMNVQGNIGSFSVNLTGSPTSLIQRNSSGCYYLDFKISKMNLEGLVDLSVDNYYYFNGSKFYTKQFNQGSKKIISEQNYLDTYGAFPTEMLLDINPETVDLHSFTYDSFTERYTATLSFKQKDGKSLGLEKYSRMISAFAYHHEVRNDGIDMQSVAYTFIINKKGQFVAMNNSENWNGSVTWLTLNLNCKIKISASMLWTFRYPKTLTTATYTF